MKIIFILKLRTYHKTDVKSYGLINSANQVAHYLESIGHNCKVVQIIDANSIDRELFEFKPDLVIIEALWVPTFKLKELIEIPRYNKINWIVRVHSDAGFLNAETLALTYVNEYINLMKSNLFISCNNNEFNKYLSSVLNYEFLYLPNIITIKDEHKHEHKHEQHHIDIACFGALRILKNQLFQAICSISAADKLHKKLKFHITADVKTQENYTNTNSVLKNLEELFKNSNHELIIHPWMENHEFHNLIKKMDLGLQISYSESFNIVTADFVNHGIPIIVSDAIDWMPFIMKVSTVDYDKVIDKIIYIYHHRNSVFMNSWCKRNLKHYNETAQHKWNIIEKFPN